MYTDGSPEYIMIDWDIPYDGSAPITGYIVEIIQYDLDYSKEITNCDAEHDALIIEKTRCQVLIADIIEYPFYN